MFHLGEKVIIGNYERDCVGESLKD